jgi:cytochrome P450
LIEESLAPALTRRIESLVVGMMSRFSNMIEWLVASIAVTLLMVWIQRQRTKRMLETCGFPTVFWRPRFMTYRPFEQDEQKLASTTITRILPRMKRLGGPYGMYGTVYGVSTPVVHMAHPVPAKAVLNGISSSGSSSHAAAGYTKEHTTNHHQPRRSSASFLQSAGVSKAPAYNHFKNFCGEGVFTADGDDWKAKRTAVMHTLIKGTNLAVSDISKRLEQEANRAANVFCRQVECLEKDMTTILVPDVVPLLQRATIGLIYRYITHDEPDWQIPRVAFKTSDHSSDDETVDDDSLSLSSSEDGYAPYSQESESLLASYLNSIVRIRMIILAQSRSIWFVLPRWCYRLFSSLYRDEEITLGPIREFAIRACDKAKPGSPLYKLSSSEGPYMSKQTQSAKQSQASDRRISKNLLDEAITLLFAGQDTSAATLSWTLHLLSLYPEIQDKLALEIQKVFKKEIQDNPQCSNNNKKDEEDFTVVTRKMISKMPCLDAVVKESMRLYPVAPFIVRRLTESIAVSSEDAKASTILPSGVVVCIWIYGLHRNPAFWDRPDEFLPERWCNPQLKDVGQTNGAYMPFASGPRNCLGQPLAHVILRTLLSKLVYRYEFIDPRMAADPDCDKQRLRKDMQAGFTVLPTGGVELIMRRRIDEKIKIN